MTSIFQGILNPSYTIFGVILTLLFMVISGRIFDRITAHDKSRQFEDKKGL